MIRGINEYMRTFYPHIENRFESVSSPDITGSRTQTHEPRVPMAPPSSFDYINVLRAYSMSKARRKGEQCEALMTTMMEVSRACATEYGRLDDEDELQTWKKRAEE